MEQLKDITFRKIMKLLSHGGKLYYGSNQSVYWTIEFDKYGATWYYHKEDYYNDTVEKNKISDEDMTHIFSVNPPHCWKVLIDDLDSLNIL